MKLVILGATGNVGSRLARIASQSGTEVTAYARNTDKLAGIPDIAVVKGELADTTNLAKSLDNADSVVVLLAAGFSDTTLLQRTVPLIIQALETLPEAARPQLVFTSVFGADKSRERASAFARMIYSTVLNKFLADRTAALKLFKESGLDFVTAYPVNLSSKAKHVQADVVPLKEVKLVPWMPELNMDSAAEGLLALAKKQAPSGSSFLISAPDTWK